MSTNLKRTKARGARRSTLRAESGKKGVSLSKEALTTIKAAKLASATEIRISKALDLSVQFIVKGKLIETSTKGGNKFVKEIPKVKSKIDLSKGAKICLKPKG